MEKSCLTMSPNCNNRVVRVALPLPLPTPLDYQMPISMQFPADGIGLRVRVPVGKRYLTGVVLGVSEEAHGPLRSIESVIDDRPLLDRETLELLQFAADYYHHPIGQVIAAALPGKLKKQAGPKMMKWWQLMPQAPLSTELSSRAQQQRRLLDGLRFLGADRHPVNADQISQIMEKWHTSMKTLIRKGWVEVTERSMITPLSESMLNEAETTSTLNIDQQRIVDEIWPQSQERPAYSASLLYGVTGSGKTEVYFHLIERCLELGEQVLILVPEIGLAPQMEARLRRRFSCAIGVLHSGMTEYARRQTWIQAGTGAVRIILGTRSTVFVPFAQLGLILVDEEHDPSFKQQEGFRYHARDLAVWRARQRNIPILMGSATPSMETWQHAQTHQYRMFRLAQRHGSIPLPNVSLIDLRYGPVTEGLSEALIQAVRDRLERQEQALLFLNRRGFAPRLFCGSCGWIAQCRHCDANMVWHRGSNRLQCHQCGAMTRAPIHCPQCGDSSQLVALGYGTERVEMGLRRFFPEASVLRMDRDQRLSVRDLAETMEAIAQGRYSILIGTQMLTKGHHFPKLTLVGVVDADQGLYSVDYRAQERLAQQLMQVGGRAGREQLPGEVLIQTRWPDHPLLQLLIRQDYEQIAAYLLEARQQMRMPPFAYSAMIRAEAKSNDAVLAFLKMLRDRVDTLPNAAVQVLGPVPAPMVRRAGYHRGQLLLLSSQRRLLHRYLNAMADYGQRLPRRAGMRWSIDVDPLDLY